MDDERYTEWGDDERTRQRDMALEDAALARQELLPCPFCGGEARAFSYESAVRGKIWRVICSQPFCCSGPDGATEAEAIEAWSTRADQFVALLPMAFRSDLFAYQEGKALE